MTIERPIAGMLSHQTSKLFLEVWMAEHKSSLPEEMAVKSKLT